DDVGELIQDFYSLKIELQFLNRSSALLQLRRMSKGHTRGSSNKKRISRLYKDVWILLRTGWNGWRSERKRDVKDSLTFSDSKAQYSSNCMHPQYLEKQSTIQLRIGTIKPEALFNIIGIIPSKHGDLKDDY
uniref:Uncharacterized protein n=1 Tax=Megaselia scalaris TaxID=36166 RepID=T1H369_MEGSC